MASVGHVGQHRRDLELRGLALAVSLAVDTPLLRIVRARADSDCAVAALAMLLGKTYEDVFAVAAGITPNPHIEGLALAAVRTVADILGSPLSLRHTVDYRASTGLLWLCSSRGKAAAHVVVLTAGLLFDTNGSVWTPTDYLATKRFNQVRCLLQRRDHE